MDTTPIFHTIYLDICLQCFHSMLVPFTSIHQTGFGMDKIWQHEIANSWIQIHNSLPSAIQLPNSNLLGHIPRRKHTLRNVISVLHSVVHVMYNAILPKQEFHVRSSEVIIGNGWLLCNPSGSKGSCHNIPQIFTKLTPESRLEAFPR